ncbi:MAG: hypothetical protein CO093_05380 [Alphaproteobacteria bacterium CG_4_9_14_3_um_filter_47_13]|nr:MAG: hypothetical protein CO093_05380 [Alphaproteobacteria bacterium CG_4_9_14_3_um_filter_47_13]
MILLVFLQKDQHLQAPFRVNILFVVIRLTARKPLAGIAFDPPHSGIQTEGSGCQMSQRAL